MAQSNIPGKDDVFLDHVGIFSRTAEEIAVLETLGFTLTDFAVHMSSLKPGDPMSILGSGNRCVMLDEGYFEVLTTTADTPMAHHLSQRMDRYLGLHLIAFSATDPERFHARVTGEGLDPVPLARIARPVDTEDGENTGQFAIVRVAPNAWEEGRVQTVFHLTPEIDWARRYRRHANGAVALTAFLYVVPDPAEASARFGRFVGRAPKTVGRCQALRLDRGVVLFCTPQDLDTLVPGVAVPSLPFIPAMSIRVVDIANTEALLAAAGVSFQAVGGEIVVAPEACLGASIVFHEAAEPRWLTGV